jgi:hypothetical protein
MQGCANNLKMHRATSKARLRLKADQTALDRSRPEADIYHSHLSNTTSGISNNFQNGIYLVHSSYGQQLFRFHFKSINLEDQCNLGRAIRSHYIFSRGSGKKEWRCFWLLPQWRVPKRRIYGSIKLILVSKDHRHHARSQNFGLAFWESLATKLTPNIGGHWAL